MEIAYYRTVGSEHRFDLTILGLQGSSEDEAGELSQEEFFDKLSPFLGPRISREDMAQTFMKIDADCGGTVNWCDPDRCASGPASNPQRLISSDRRARLAGKSSRTTFSCKNQNQSLTTRQTGSSFLRYPAQQQPDFTQVAACGTYIHVLSSSQTRALMEFSKL